MRRFHVADHVAVYDKFRAGLIALVGSFEFEGVYRATLLSHRQAGAESVAAYATHMTELCSQANANITTEAQFSLAVDHFIAGLADVSSREYLQRERAQQSVEWMEAVRIAQASETTHLSNTMPNAAAPSLDPNTTATSAAARETLGVGNSVY